ncbi:MAG: hypothetical protein PG981_000039 [Wolbachia endosymbiont of Ctenocephalides orientis wCori]|nr:MAG: hypothetical protein PG981_000039 [Wolbachia endosymbiont of Ctenocephalides orientis wCori]
MKPRLRNRHFAIHFRLITAWQILAMLDRGENHGSMLLLIDFFKIGREQVSGHTLSFLFNKRKNLLQSSKSVTDKMSIKNFLLIFLAQVLYCFPLFSADPVLLNCIKTPEIYDLDAGPKDFNHSNNLRRKPGSPNVAAGS